MSHTYTYDKPVYRNDMSSHLVAVYRSPSLNTEVCTGILYNLNTWDAVHIIFSTCDYVQDMHATDLLNVKKHKQMEGRFKSGDSSFFLPCSLGMRLIMRHT